MRSQAARSVDEQVTSLRPVPEEAELRPFGPDSMSWDDMGNTLNLLLIGGAFVLQAMHPTISTAVDRHSVFRTDPLGRAVRSSDSVLLWIYGGQAAIEEGVRLRELHKPIRGKDADGRRYSALNPEAYAWVHGTAFATAVKTHPYLHGREMTTTEQRRYYDEVLQLGDILQIPRKLMPATVDEYWDYYAAMVSERLERTPVAEEVLEMVSTPPLPFGLGPLTPLAWPGRKAIGHVSYLLTVGGMTDDAKEVLGAPWSAWHEAQLRALMSTLRPVHRRLPEQLRYMPLALHARRHARELDAIRARATVSVA